MHFGIVTLFNYWGTPQRAPWANWLAEIPANFVIQLLTRMEMSDGVEWGMECEVVRNARVELARILDCDSSF